MPSILDPDSVQVLEKLRYFYEGDPKLEECIEHLWVMSHRVSGGVRLLLHGETGTGKEALAHAAHHWISEKPGNLVTVNCAAVNEGTAVADFFGAKKGSYTGSVGDSPGIFGQAPSERDTVFLDEVHRIPSTVRASLLRVLAAGKFRRLGDKEETSFKGNVIAASSSNIASMTARNEFPRDLYHRLSTGGEVKVPSLRERSLEYRDALLNFGCEHWGIDPFSLEKDLRQSLLEMRFPGNVRELQGILHQLSKYARSKNGIASKPHLERILKNRAPIDYDAVELMSGNGI